MSDPARELAMRESALRADVASAVAHGRTLGAMLTACTAALVHHLDASFARIWVVDSAGSTLLLRASSGLYTHIDGGHARVPIGSFKIGRIAATGLPHCTNDVQRDPLVDPAWATQQKLVSFAGYPVTQGDRLLGVVALFSHHTLPDVTLQLLASIADLIGVGIDRERADAAVLAREARYRSLVAATSQIVWSTDAQGKIHDDCPARLAATGPSKEDWLAGSASAAIHPGDLARVRDGWARALLEAEPFTLAYRLHRADGAFADVVARAVPVKDADGAIAEWVGTISDVTEQRRAEAAASLERSRLRQVLEHVPAAITTSRGPTHVIEGMNAMSRRLIGGRDLAGRTTREAFPEVEGQGYFELLDTVYASGEPFFAQEAPVRFDRSGDGTPTVGYFNVAYQPLLDAAGKVDGILSFSVEVTAQVEAREGIREAHAELARANLALSKKNAELDQFAYVASHDLKAPLRGIGNLAQWIEEDLGAAMTPAARENMMLLNGRVHRLEALIDGILAYSRAGRTSDKLEEVDTSELLAEVGELLAPQNARGPGAGAVRAVSQLPVVIAERVKLQQVLLNLVGNALKHSRRADALIEVGAEDDGAAWQFFVRDNGPGIAPEFHERIWTIFQTLEARDTVEGTGIGLSVVRKIVETHGGRAWLEERGGPGATFRFTWPKTATHPAAPATAAEERI